MPENQDISIHFHGRNEVTDLIEIPPSWLLRSGITMVAIVLISILSMSAFISYPEKIIAIGTLSSKTPPIEIISNSEGYIQDIFIKDQENVQSGTTILAIKNTAKPEDISRLQSWINVYKEIDSPNQFKTLKIPQELQLGIIQQGYASLVLKYQEFQQHLRDGTILQQSHTIKEEIQKIKSLNNSHKKEKELYTAELELQKKEHGRNKILIEKGAISQLEFEQSQTALLQKERQFESLENTAIQNSIRIEQLNLENQKLLGDRRRLLRNYDFQLAEIISKLEVAFEDWSENYEMKAPIEGELSFATEIKLNKFLQKGQLIGHIIPMTYNETYVSIKAPITNAGKLEVGQKVILKFDAFPYKEFGIIETGLTEITKVPQFNEQNEPYYELKASLKEPLFTDFGNEIPYKPDLMVGVEIITQDKTILQRIFQQLLSLIQHS